MQNFSHPLIWVFISFFLLATSAEAAVCAKLYPELWRMELKREDVGQDPAQTLRRPSFVQQGKLKNQEDRMSIGQAPDGRPALEMKVFKGENRITSFHSKALRGRDITKACLSADIYYPDEFDVGTSGTKIGIGLWGSDGGGKRRISGGWPPELQNGWTVRLLNNRRGIRAYAYHLERGGKRRDQQRCAPHKCLYGDVIGPATKFSKDRWVPVDLEVILNDVGKKNGRLRFWIDGEIAGSETGLVFRHEDDWHIEGMVFTDMWGGSTHDPKNFSPREQQHWYANYRIFGEP